MGTDSDDKIDTIEILQICNIGIIFVFLIIFCYRSLSLRHMGNQEEHINKYPKKRIGIAISYIIISIGFLITYLIGKKSDVEKVIFDGGVGQCLNSFILLIHLIVLKQQLTKKQPYTKIHLVYMIYLPLISLTRAVFALFTFENEQEKSQIAPDKIITAFSFILLFISFVLCFLWVKKRKQLPDNDEYIHINKESFANFTNPLSNRSYDIAYSKHFQKKIFPTVTVQRGKIRIILQVFANNEFLKSAFQENFNSQDLNSRPLSEDPRKNQHLQIISNRLYSIEQIKHMYIECNRFNIETRLHFKNFKMGKFYQDLKKFLDELFQIKKSYIPEILKLFYIEKYELNSIEKNIRKECISSNQMDVCGQFDNNAMFLSINLFKNFWAQDHFIFYMHVKSVDFKDKATFYKRYSDFEDFHKGLQKILRESNLDSYKLPPLPKKHLYSWNYEQIRTRQQYLQCYCREIANDYFLMKSVPPVRQFILNFMGLQKILYVELDEKKHDNFYKGLYLKKGNISQALVNEEYVTYYEFKIKHSEQEISHVISKRFQSFVHLHQAIQRWMENIGISYKFLVLPDKILFTSESDRHEKLLKYLEALITIKQIYRVYPVTKFLNLGQDGGKDLSRLGLSIIKKPSQEGVEKQSDRLQFSRNSSYNMKHGSNISELIEDLVVE